MKLLFRKESMLIINWQGWNVGNLESKVWKGLATRALNFMLKPTSASLASHLAHALQVPLSGIHSHTRKATYLCTFHPLAVSILNAWPSHNPKLFCAIISKSNYKHPFELKHVTKEYSIKSILGCQQNTCFIKLIPLFKD
jgi:hypothetical protein